MDVELLVLMRHRRRQGRSGWRKPAARHGKTEFPEQTFEAAGGRMKDGRGGARTPLIPDLTTQGVAMTDSSADSDTGTNCHDVPLPPQHYCPDCGAYNPDEGDARG